MAMIDTVIEIGYIGRIVEKTPDHPLHAAVEMAICLDFNRTAYLFIDGREVCWVEGIKDYTVHEDHFVFTTEHDPNEQVITPTNF